MRVSWAVAGFALSLAVPAAAAGTCENADFYFNRYSLEQGLSQGYVYCIEQDLRGFLWIGTRDGLNRFDGSRFVVFNHDPYDSTTLSDNQITSLHVDPDGSLWVGTSYGLNLMSPGWPGFSRFVKDPSQSNSLVNNAITSLQSDMYGRLWIGTSDGLDRFDPRTGQFIHFRHFQSDSQSISDSAVECILADSGGALWVGTLHGLNRVDPTTGRSDRFYPAGDREDDDANRILAIEEAENGELLVGTAAGPWLLNAREGAFRPLLRARGQGRPAEDGGEPVADILRDKSGTVWMATYDGLLIVKPDGEIVAKLRHDSADPTSLSGNGIACLFQDWSEVIWAGTTGYGLNSWSSYLRKFERYAQGTGPSGLGFRSVRAIYEDPSGVVWVGGYGGGLNRLDPTSGDFTRSRDVPSGVIRTILGDPDAPEETLWIGTEGEGLLRYDVKPRTFRRYPVRSGQMQGLSGRNVYAMCVGPEGRLWIGTERGVNVFDRTREEFTLLDCCPSGRSVHAIARDRTGSMWVGALGGLGRLDPGAGDFAYYNHDPADDRSLSSDEVFCVHEDAHGTIWVGTSGGGLNKLDRGRGAFTHYLQKHGLPNNVVYGILEDDEGRLWLSTNAGISRFDPKSETFRNFYQDSGLQSLEFNAGAYHRGPSGKLYFGGVAGFNVIDPVRLGESPHPPLTILTDFLLSNKPVPAAGSEGGRRLLESPIYDTDALELSHRDRVISFELAALNFASPSTNTFAYKLEGLDEDWNYIGGRRFITFTDLKPGEYRLLVKAANSDGVWSNAPSTLRIMIKAPYWQTLWFRGSVVAALGAVVFLLHRVRTNSIRRRGAEISRSREFLNSIVNALDDPVFVKDEDHRWVVLNDKACEMMGLPREELLGKTDYDVFPHGSADLLCRGDDEAFANEGAVVENEDAVNWQGEPRIISTKESVFRERATGNHFIACIVRDITDLKRSEKELEGRLLFESLASGISAKLINPPISEIDRVIEERLREIGRFFSADRVVIRLMRGEDGLPAKVYAWSVDTPSSSQVRADFEASFPNLAEEMRRDREVVFHRISDIPAGWRPELEHLTGIGIKSGVVVPLSVGGSLLGSISVLMMGAERIWEESTTSRVRILGEALANALNRKRAEEALRRSQQKYWSILENIGIGITLVGSDMKILETNKKMREWFPNIGSDVLPFCQQPHGLGLGEHTCPDCPTASALRDGQVHERTSSACVGSRSASFRIVSSPIWNSEGDVVAAIELVEDITERQRLEDQLRHSQKMEAIGTLAGGIAHDFNNILYAILGYANLAKARTSADHGLRDYLEQIEIAGHRAAKLVEQILAFGRRSESGTAPVRLQNLLEETLALLRGSLPATVEIREDIAGDCGYVMADPTQVHQVVMNLCTNAFQAMPNRKGTLEVSLDEVEVDAKLAARVHGLHAGRFARLTVRDDGIGMEADVVKRIFEPYFTTKQSGEGSGLGLAMVHGIVKSHRGAIDVSSAPDFGSCFEVYLPIFKGAARKDEGQSPGIAGKSLSARILLVDDESMIAEMCKRILSNHGHHVTTYTDSVEALKAFRSDPGRYDLIITDVTMPRLTGLELADAVRSAGSDIPILLCTGYGNSIDKTALEELNIQACIWKPLEVQDLAEKIQQALAFSRATEV